MYIDTLCVVAQYENENSEKALAFVERIHSGAGLTNNFSEHIDGVEDISSEQLHAFVDVCKKNKLENIFVLDCILTAQADGVRNEEQCGFALDLAEALGLKEDRVSLLSELADVVSEKDSEKYHELYEKLSPADAAEVIGGAVGYVKEFVSGVLIDTPELLWICSQKREGYVVEKCDHSVDDDSTNKNSFGFSFLERIASAIMPADINYDGYIKVVIENAVIKSTLGFVDCKSVILKNCNVKNPISINNVDSVIVSGCAFDFNKEKQTGSVYAAKVSHISICDCKFSNFVFEGDSDGLINCFDCGGCDLSIEDTSFFNLSNSTGYVIIPLKSGAGMGLFGQSRGVQSLTLRNCDFTNCTGKALFPSDMDKVSENNTYNNCCKEDWNGYVTF